MPINDLSTQLFTEFFFQTTKQNFFKLPSKFNHNAIKNIEIEL